MDPHLSARRLLFDITDSLEQIPLDPRSAALEASAILEYVLKTESVKILADLIPPPSPDQICAAWKIVDQRLARKPLAHILGYSWFYNNKFYVTDRLLVPRQETEILVDEAVKFLKNHNRSDFKILDLYTGCGNVILSIADECESISGIGIDSDPDTISCAVKNSESLAITSIDFQCIDTRSFLENPPSTFNLITANPPYIPSADIPDLQPEISIYENSTALDGGPDGLSHYRLLASMAKRIIEPGGILLSEIGINQKDAVSDLFSAWSIVQFQNDLEGTPRVLLATP